MGVQLAELVKDWPCTVKGSIRTEIIQVEDDARRVKPGDLFIARKGKHYHGLTFLDEAMEKGAVAIAVEDEMQFDSLKLPIPIVWVPNCLSFLAFASAKLYGFPAEALSVIAVTGTNGKTTVTHFIGQLLTKLQQRVMVIGTNGIFIDGEKCYQELESLTTLQSKHLQFLLSKALEQKIDYVVLEASSMGLAKHRLDHCEVSLGVFLNVTEDHIEDHGSFDDYKKSKQLLTKLTKKILINNDDAVCRSIGIIAKNKKYYFGTGNKVDVHLQLLYETSSVSVCCIQADGEKHVVTLPIIGEYQRNNVLAALSSLAILGLPFHELCQATQSLSLPKGRFEQISNPLGVKIYIDYAHTADAMKGILQTLKKHASNRLIVVFSCGGDRDQAKRPKMGMVASAFADYIILTTDNSRGESPQKINEQIRKGFSSLQQFESILDRQQAIEKAIKMARQGDTIVILGKGHEQTQQIGQQTTHFSDKECVELILKQLEVS